MFIFWMEDLGVFLMIICKERSNEFCFLKIKILFLVVIFMGILLGYFVFILVDLWYFDFGILKEIVVKFGLNGW